MIRKGNVKPQYPLLELKRHLCDDAIPLPKRLRLAKNVVQSQHFPTVPKERVVGEWVNKLLQEGKITSREMREILSWLNGENDFTNDLKHKIIKVVSQFLHGARLQDEDITSIILFLTNKKYTVQFNDLPDNFLFITKTVLKTLHSVRSQNVQKINAVLNNVSSFYNETRKKLEFLANIIYGECLEQIFGYLNTECHDAVMNLCENIFFPSNNKQSFLHFFNQMIKNDNVDDIASDKSESMQSVVKIMRAFFTFPDGRVDADHSFLIDFITTFVSCFRSDNQIVFVFYVIATTTLNMPQNYLIPAMKMPPVMFEENNDKIKRNIFLKMLESLLNYEVDITIRLTDTCGERQSKVEVKKTFITFLQTVMLGQLKMEGKLDKATLRIIKTALKLDPSLVEQKMDQILPHIMTARKNNSDFLECYTDMVNFLLETLFKLSRGTVFVNQMIPHLKASLEANNIEQFELKQKLNETTNTNLKKKITSKIISGKDIFPLDCIVTYGRLTSDLLFRQNKDLLLSLQKDFEENCLMMLEEGFVSPSIITLAEILVSILSSFLHNCKMADHTVPQNVAEEFWAALQNFEDQCLNKFGKCILKLNYNPQLVLAFLKLSLSLCHLKLLNIKYSNTKLKITENDLLPFLSKEKWLSLTEKIQEEESKLIWIQLLLTKTMAIELLSKDTADEKALKLISETKSVIIEQILSFPQFLLYDNYLTSCLFRNLDKHQLKQLSKSFLRSYAFNLNIKIFKTDAVVNNRELLQALLFRVIKIICDCIENTGLLSKALSKNSFNVTSFVQEIDVKDFINSTSMRNEDEIADMLDVMKELQINYLEENYQLTAIFILLVVKKCCQTKKLRKTTDYLLQIIFESSTKSPDLYKLFSIDYMFDFNDNSLLELFKLTIRTPNNNLIIKSVLETAVKKVKTDPEVVKKIVEILLTSHKTKGNSIQYFKEPVFQISSTILPMIAKEKRAIKTSAYRSILANLQDKLNKSMLELLKAIDFGSNLADETDNTDDILVDSEKEMAILNAMGAYSLSLLTYCETNDADEQKSMECLLTGLEFFVHSAIQTIQCPSSKNQQIENSVHLLNVTLRYIKKLETHKVFRTKNKIYRRIWQSITSRLSLVYSAGGQDTISVTCMDEIAIALKFLAELSNPECFSKHFVGDLAKLALLKKPSIILKNADVTNEQLTIRKVAKCLWQNCLKANIVEPKCVAMTKLIARTTKNVKFWIQQHYNCVQNGGKGDTSQDIEDEMEIDENKIIEANEQLHTLKVDDSICELLRYDLDILSEVILAAKKISLDYILLDSIFELHHLMHFILGRATIDVKCEISWQGFVTIFYGSVAILNNLLLSREELLEDRWPCFMQCYKALVLCLCERSTSQSEMDNAVEYKLADMAHSIEKLTQAICKRRTHVSRISAYAVSDFCTWLEQNPPPKIVRQHIENSISLLIQVSDSTYALAFLRRSLAGSVGQTTMTNMYTTYKRYHKYVGNA
ncbi:jg8121 [Pararge aegeria aegeria]|uniref:Jg8121 protein n=4 Tax=Pararge aegeria TaxID=116150 RepID=A0A8S4RZ83_9NEOP|nr:jg8121 [Pararge aegeria aegeria]